MLATYRKDMGHGAMRQFTATCQKPCCDWENFLHIERCWRGNPAQMIRVSGFGEDGLNHW